MTTLFVSDIHLSRERPDIVERFIAFLDQETRAADALYILGDLFDLWLGDDDDREPHPRVVGALRRRCDSGLAVRVMHGNHDFLLGGRFEAESGCRLLPEPARIDVPGASVIALHGDVLCTRDEDYQAFRRRARDPQRQAEFLRLPLPARLEHAAHLRHRSQQATRLKASDIMDVTPEAVERMLRDTGARCMIHGHTHRPAVHALECAGESATRIVLGDWYEQGSVLVWNEAGFRSEALDDRIEVRR